MEQKMVKSTQRQLRGLADGIGGAGDEQAAVLMAQAGASLMANCVKLCSAALGGMSEGSFADVMDACAMMSRKTAEMLNYPRCASLTGQAQLLAQLRRAGEAAAATGGNLQQEIDRLRKENARAEKENRDLDAEARTLLQSSMKLAGEIEALQNGCHEARERMQRMAEKKAELDRQWSGIEPELQQRVRETRDLEQTLERLRTRQQDFSPERQTQLRTEIEALKEQTRSDKRAVDGLNDVLIELRRSAAQQEDERSLLEGEALSAVQSALSRLDAASARRLNQLEGVQRTVDTLNERLAQCRSLHADYESWLDANSAAMDELARILGENDPLNGSLRETLDPAQTARLRRLRESAEESLRQMDELLTPCIRLMSSNRRAVLGKVSQGPGRREAANEG